MQEMVVAVLFPWRPEEKVIGVHCCQTETPSPHFGSDPYPTGKPCGGLLIREDNDGRTLSCTIRCEKCGLSTTSRLGKRDFDSLRAKHTLQLIGSYEAIPEHDRHDGLKLIPYRVELTGQVFQGRFGAYRWLGWAKTDWNLVVPAQLVTGGCDELTPAVYNFLPAVHAIAHVQLSQAEEEVKKIIEKKRQGLAWLHC